MRVIVIGAGRLGRTLAVLLPRAGVDVELCGRGAPIPTGALYWLTVRDGQIGEAAAALPPEGIRLHASGACGPEALGEAGERGVLHPLMTFPGPEIAIPELHGVFAAVSGTPAATAAALDLAHRLGMAPQILTGDRRLYHAAAVMASSHLAAGLLAAAAVLARAGVTDPAAALLPLTQESLRRAASAGPAALTGPAVRGDRAVEDAHRSVLTPTERRLYDELSERVRMLLRVTPTSNTPKE